jgi:hypothetical protein
MIFRSIMSAVGIPEGSRLPRWALALRSLLFPIVALRVRLSRHYIPGAEFDPATDTVIFAGDQGGARWSFQLLSGDRSAEGMYKSSWRPSMRIWEFEKLSSLEDLENIVRREIEDELSMRSQDELEEIRLSLGSALNDERRGQLGRNRR